MKAKPEKMKIWHPVVPEYYGGQLRFVLVTTQAHVDGLREHVALQFPFVDIYEILGKVDLFVRVYSDSSTLNRVVREFLTSGGTCNIFVVDRIHRIWGSDVPTVSAPAVDVSIARRIDEAFPDVSAVDLESGLLIGVDRPPLTDLRAFIMIRLDNPDSKTIHRLAQRIIEDAVLRQKVFGVYEGMPTIGVDGHLLLEISLTRFRDYYLVLRHFHELAYPTLIKTTTFPISYSTEVTTGFKFHETPELLVRIYTDRFPGLATIPSARVLSKIACLEPLRDWWHSSTMIGAWAKAVSQALIDEKEQHLAGPVSEISLRLERHLKGALIRWAKDKYGERSWDSASTQTLQMKTSLTRSSLGQLVHGARNVSGEVPVRLASIEAFVQLRNRIVHDDAGGQSAALDFVELERTIPTTIARVFADHESLFAD